MIKTKLFTLIELLITIVVIGILAAIVIPNISNFKQESTTAAMQANIKNIETAISMYALENHGKYPTEEKPLLGEPEPLLFGELHPDHLRKLPKVKGMKYWVDYTGGVWASLADSPIGVYYQSSGSLSWAEAENAVGYNVYKYTASNNLTSSANQGQLVFVTSTEDIEVELSELEEGNFYLVSSIDHFGLESPPASSKYQGYSLPLLENEELGDGETQLEPFPWPLDRERPTWKSSDPALRDRNSETFVQIRSAETYTIEWNEDMENRVFQFEFGFPDRLNPSRTKQINFLNKAGENLPFINAWTDELYSTYDTEYSSTRTSLDFVVPRGAVKVEVSGSMIVNLHKADFVDDLSLPHPVTNVQRDSTTESITLTWDAPSRENFLKAAVYSNGKFVGYGENGTFTHHTLYSDMEYDYFIEPVSVVGNRGQRVYLSQNTKSKDVVWRGLENAAAFDSYIETYTPVTTGDEVSWIGNLEDRQITIQHRISNANRSIKIAFYNNTGVIIPSKLANSNESVDIHTISSSSNAIPTITKFVVPEGASRFRFVDGSQYLRVHSVAHGNTLELPSKLMEITAIPSTNSLLMTLKKPSDVERVAIFRDGKFLAFTSSNSFTDVSLYSNQDYTYTFETFNHDGNRLADGGELRTKTNKAEIDWRGLSGAEAFDSDLSTYTDVLTGDEISWIGNLTDRQINIHHRGSGANRTINLAFYDSNNQIVPSRLANSINAEGVHSIRSVNSTILTITSLLVPERAKKIVLSSVSGHTRFYSVSHGDTLELPRNLTNVTGTSTSNTVTLTFNKPSDVEYVGVYRDGNLVVSTDESTFVDTSLYSNQEYTYTFETFNSAGNRSKSIEEFKITTEHDGIAWRGLANANAFDGSLSTFTNIETGDEISWEGNIANRPIEVYHRNAGSIRNFTVAFYDANNNIVASSLGDETTPMNTHSIKSSSNSTPNGTVLIVPSGAVKLRIVSASNELRFHSVLLN